MLTNKISLVFRSDNAVVSKVEGQG